MNGGKILEQIEIDLRSHDDHVITVYIDVYENSLSRKWLAALDGLLTNQYHLEKNYCFFGFPQSERNGPLLLEQINHSIRAINQAELGYYIDDEFSMENCVGRGAIGDGLPGRQIIHEKFNRLHRYFEDLQGQSGKLSPFFHKADAHTRWHIRQLNLLCHEFESWALSYCKEIKAPRWMRPSQLMCWLNAPRFVLEQQDFELFGIETLNRPLGGVFMGVNKSVGKHHWEVFTDEGRDSRIGELTTSSLISQTEGSGDFDIEWANNPGEFHWQKKQLEEFRGWLIDNGFDPNDKTLTIGHPQVAQVDLVRSFDSDDYRDVWQRLNTHLDVYAIRTSTANAIYSYRWSDEDFVDRQVKIISGGTAKCNG
jgi:hypothetical protein